MLKSCSTCKRDLRIECFPRKKQDTRWLGEARASVPRDNSCSECISLEAKLRTDAKPLEEALIPHVNRARLRTKNRSLDPNLDEEGITPEIVATRFRQQEGRCSTCGVSMSMISTGMGFGLCSEDRIELATARVPPAKDLIVIDRLNTTDPTAPYFHAKTNTPNFDLKCYTCNKDKAYEEDIPSMLRERLISMHAELKVTKESRDQLYESLTATTNDPPLSEEDATIESLLTLVKRQKLQIEYLTERNHEHAQQIKTYQKLASENWVLSLSKPSPPNSPIEKKSLTSSPPHLSIPQSKITSPQTQRKKRPRKESTVQNKRQTKPLLLLPCMTIDLQSLRKETSPRIKEK